MFKGSAQPQGYSSIHEGAKPRPATELEGVIDELSGAIDNLEVNIHEIGHRVMPSPQPVPGTAPSAVPVTYAQKIRELTDRIGRVREIVGEMNGRI